MSKLLPNGDLLIDSFTRDRDVLIYKISESFPGLKEEATIWVDGNALEGCTSFKIFNGSDTTPWHIKKAEIRVVQGTRQPHIKSNNVNYGFCCHGLEHLTFANIKSEGFGGKGFPFVVSVVGDGYIKIRDIEGVYGFASLRIPGNVEAIVTLDISNFKVHDTVTGEGLYIGHAKTGPVTKFKGTINTGTIARTACEALQLQHCAGLDVYDITCFAANTEWICPFQPYQDTAIQWNCASGNNQLRNILVDSFASLGVNMFGGDGVGSINKASNMLFYGGRGSGIRMDATCKKGGSWLFNDIHFGGWTDEYYTKTRVSGDPYLLPSMLGSDYLQINNFSSNQISKPEYVNSGFESSNIQQWKPYYLGHLQGGNQEVKTTWKKGEIVIETNGEYAFYRTLVDHQTDLISPKNSDKFEPVKWDGNLLPPDDLRLVKKFL